MIILTTAKNTGDLDPNGPYTHVKILYFTFNTKDSFIIAVTAIGYIASEVFVEGISNLRKEVMITGQDYLDLIAMTPDSGLTIYAAAAKKLYQYLIDHGHFVGSVE